MTIRLKNCTCKPGTIPSDNDLSIVEKVSVKQEQGDTVLRLQLRNTGEKTLFTRHNGLLPVTRSAGPAKRVYEIAFSQAY